VIQEQAYVPHQFALKSGEKMVGAGNTPIAGDTDEKPIPDPVARA